MKYRDITLSDGTMAVELEDGSVRYALTSQGDNGEVEEIGKRVKNPIIIARSQLKHELVRR